ncbi:MAG: hypothetical protein ABJM59_02450, partial [Parasphingorhabdus sp.]
RMVQKLTEIRTPIVWINGEIRRVLNTDLKVEDQVLLLLASSSAKVSFEDLVEWTETSNRTYLKKIVMGLHKSRVVEAQDMTHIKTSPKAAKRIRDLMPDLD